MHASETTRAESSAAERPSVALENLCINTIRFLAVDAAENADSGHPGLPMGAAPMAFVLWTRFLKHNPQNPNWWDRDRFILSAGHGSMLLYALLHLTGYALSMEDIRQFRSWGSKTPGHPERGAAPGVEVTTGPLGQGFANGVGMAIAERNLAARFNRPGFEIVNHYTFAIVGDGDLMEGVSSEAASLAGHLGLGRLIYLYDDNRISLSESTNLSFTEDRARRFEAYGWHTQTIKDGNDLEAIERAISAAQLETQRPSLILVRTHIGYGSPHRQDTFEVHGSPLGQQEVEATKSALGWPLAPDFFIPDEVQRFFRSAIDAGSKAESVWGELVSQYATAFPELASQFQKLMLGELAQDWDAEIPSFATDAKGIATRAASGRILNTIAKRIPALIGGSADLNPSTRTALAGFGDFESLRTLKGDRQGASGGEWGYAGRNLHFGVREHAMGAVANGLAAHGGFIPFTATFFTFSDYMKPAIRLAALMNLHVIFIFTHDSIGLGEDGPSHQPVEHLAALRAIPNLTTIRPADANETAAAWRVAIASRNQPVALILTRQNVPTLEQTAALAREGLPRGAYVVSDASSRTPEIILIATGSEVSLAVGAQENLRRRGIQARVVSIPSWELFDTQPRDYRDSILPPSVTARLAIEAGSALGWSKYIGDRGDVISLNHFGASAPGSVVMAKLGYTVENVTERAAKLLESF